MINHKQTGKTFRNVLRALLRASEGRKLVYSCESEKMAYWYFKRAVDVCRASYLGSDIKITKYKIKFPKGVLLFKTDREVKLNPVLRQFEFVVDEG